MTSDPAKHAEAVEIIKELDGVLSVCKAVLQWKLGEIEAKEFYEKMMLHGILGCWDAMAVNRITRAELAAAAYLESRPAGGLPGGKALDICRRLVEWDRKYPKGMIHPMQGERDLDELMRDAAALTPLTPATGGEG